MRAHLSMGERRTEDVGRGGEDFPYWLFKPRLRRGSGPLARHDCGDALSPSLPEASFSSLLSSSTAHAVRTWCSSPSPTVSAPLSVKPVVGSASSSVLRRPRWRRGLPKRACRPRRRVAPDDWASTPQGRAAGHRGLTESSCLMGPAGRATWIPRRKVHGRCCFEWPSWRGPGNARLTSLVRAAVLLQRLQRRGWVRAGWLVGSARTARATSTRRW